MELNKLHWAKMLNNHFWNQHYIESWIHYEHVKHLKKQNSLVLVGKSFIKSFLLIFQRILKIQNLEIILKLSNFSLEYKNYQELFVFHFQMVSLIILPRTAV